MNYAWDPRKNRANLARHGIAFEDAIRIFDGPTLEKVDDRFDYGETRIYADAPETERRIISAWRAEQHEREAYWQDIVEDIG